MTERRLGIGVIGAGGSSRLAHVPNLARNPGARVVAIAGIDPPPTHPREHYRSGPDYLTCCLLNATPFEGMITPEISRDAQEILDAGLRSMVRGKGSDCRYRHLPIGLVN